MTSTKNALHTAGTALLSIGIGLIGYGVDLHNTVGYVSIAIGVVINGIAMIAFVKIPATDTGKLAQDIRKIQIDETKLSPFLAKYGGDIEAAIKDVLQGEIAKVIKAVPVESKVTTASTESKTPVVSTETDKPKNVEAK